MKRTHYLNSFSGIFLAVCALFLILPAQGQSAKVGLRWDPSASADAVTGYKVYYGTTTATYQNVLDVGPVQTTVVSNLVSGTTYFFAVTAYNAQGLESVPSNEISYTPPAAPTLVKALPDGPGKVKIEIPFTGTVKAFRVYTNNVAMLSATVPAGQTSPFTVALPGLAAGVTYAVQAAPVDTYDAEGAKSPVASVRIPGKVVNFQRN